MNGVCWECDEEGEIHNHHVVPRSKGGARTVPLCLECHEKVHGKRMNSGELVKAAYKRLVAEHGKGNFKWGSGPVLDETRKKGLAAMQSNADADAVRLWGHIQTLEKQDEGIDISSLNWSCLSRRLNSLGVKSRRGGEIKPSNLKRTITTAIERGVIK